MNHGLQTLERKRKRDLILSISLDAIGMLSYFFPFFGGISDIIYAPIYGIAIYLMYRKAHTPALLAATLGIFEELLPLTDMVPTATMMWLYIYRFSKKEVE